MCRGTIRNADRKIAGFTIVEMLVALALVAFSLSAIGSLFFASAKGARALEEHVMLAETARLVSTSLPRREDLVPGRLFGVLSSQRWRVDIEPFARVGIQQIPDSPWIPEAVAIQVRSPSGAVITLETVRLQRKRPE